MGWLGVVFKGDISQVSDILAVALSTGYLGSLTTFSGWNQQMLQLCVNGHWVLAIIGYFIGTFYISGFRNKINIFLICYCLVNCFLLQFLYTYNLLLCSRLAYVQTFYRTNT